MKEKVNLKKMFEMINRNLSIIHADENTIKQFHEINRLFINSEIEIEYFYHAVKINEEYEGLKSETVFFDKYKIYDLVIGQHNLDYIEIALKDIRSVRFNTTPIIKNKTENNRKTNEISGKSIKVELRTNFGPYLAYEGNINQFDSLFSLFKALKKKTEWIH